MKVTFDGFGLNGQDEYATRLATFTETGQKELDGNKVAQDLNSHEAVVDALRAAMPALRGHHYPHGYDREAVLSQAFTALQRAGVRLTELIADATGEVPE